MKTFLQGDVKVKVVCYDILHNHTLRLFDFKPFTSKGTPRLKFQFHMKIYIHTINIKLKLINIIIPHMISK